MNFTSTQLQGAAIIDLETISDERGFFARSFCKQEFAVQGMKTNVMQSNISFNHNKGTLRGMHFQHASHSEAKLVRCISGSIFDVIIDLRIESPSYLEWFACELTSANRKSLYIPEGFAHGFQTLEDNSEVLYQMFDSFSPLHADGIPWDDPSFNITWPLEPSCISEKDRSYLKFNDAKF